MDGKPETSEFSTEKKAEKEEIFKVKKTPLDNPNSDKSFKNNADDTEGTVETPQLSTANNEPEKEANKTSPDNPKSDESGRINALKERRTDSIEINDTTRATVTDQHNNDKSFKNNEDDLEGKAETPQLSTANNEPEKEVYATPMQEEMENLDSEESSRIPVL